MDTTVQKNRTAKVGEKYSYKYVDLAQIHEYLESIGAKYYQFIDRLEGDDYIMTVKVIDGKEQPALRGCRVVDATLTGVNNPAQAQGSALTYARRYSLLMAYGLATEDDDAQSLSTSKEIKNSDFYNTKMASDKQIYYIERYLTGDSLAKVLNDYGVKTVSELTSGDASVIISDLKKGER